MDRLWNVCNNKDNKNKDNKNEIYKEVRYLCKQGYCTNTLLEILAEYILKNVENDKDKGILLMNLAKADKNLCEGADEELQLLNVCLNIC